MSIDEARIRRQGGDLLAAKTILESLKPADRSIAAMFECFLNFHELMEFGKAATELDAISVHLAEEPHRLIDWQFEYLLRLGEPLAAESGTMLRLLKAFDRRPTKSQALDVIARAIRRRQNIIQGRLATLDIQTEVIPLGINCLPHVLMGRWGLNKCNPLREGIGPFSLAQHTLQSVYNAIAADFSNYIDAGKMIAMRTPRGFTVPARRDGSIIWNHNASAHWTGDSFCNLVRALTNQIKDFRAIKTINRPLTFIVCLNGGPSNVLLSGNSDIHQGLAALNELLISYSGNSQCRIVALDCRHYVSADVASQLTEQVRYRHFGLPSPSYAWHTDMNLPDGIEFEERLLNFVIDGLSEWQLCCVEMGALSTGTKQMTNIALNRPATQSSTSIWSTNKSRETDARMGNNGDLVSPRCFHTNRELNPWWQVNLEGAYLIKRVIIHNRLDVRRRLTRFTLLRSNDGRKWLEFFKKTDGCAFSEFSAEITEDCLARFVRLRLDGHDVLHFRECQVFGEPAIPGDQKRLLAVDASMQPCLTLPEGRNGHISQVGGFDIFVDEDNYGSAVRRSLDSGNYEGRERNLVTDFLLHTDRVLEIGTAVGVVSMTAASIVGPTNVVTFDANPDIVADARENFRRNNLAGIVSNLGVLANRRKFEKDSYVDFYISREFWASRLSVVANRNDIVRSIKIPVLCLEQHILSHNANVLICDIEGGEVDLLCGADLSNIRLIVIETHYWSAGEAATDAMFRELILQGFSLHLGSSGGHISVLRRL
jgi:FkbM family methyltransferase